MSHPSLAACLVLVAAASAHAAFIKQPYLQNLTDSTIVVRWETQSAQTGIVEYGLTSGYGMTVTQSSPAVDHELTLTGLQFDTLYHYRAISGSDTSADAAFHSNVTVNRPFRFFVYGDNRSDSAGHQSVVTRMLQVSPTPALALNVGDLTYDGSASAYRTFFNVEPGLIRNVPMYPSLGNHDDGNMTNWYRYFALPNNELWYTLRYGNAAFHCLDNYSTYSPGSAQHDWLVSELQADSADPAVRHIFVFLHEPPYTTNTGHSSNMAVRQYLCPLFERYHVALALQGHVHCYEHSLVNGVHYIISGGGGAPLHTEWNEVQPWTVYREATFEFVLVDVSGDTVRTVGIRPDGTEFDSLVFVEPAAVAEAPPVPETNRLQAAPNPFRGRVCLTLESTETGIARVEICDVFGRTVCVLADQNPGPGRHTLVWDATSAPAGPYFAVAQTSHGEFTATLIHAAPERGH